MNAPFAIPGMLLDPTNPINRGLVGWWPMWEGAGGKCLDISGKNNHGTLTNGLVWADGLTFDGVDDSVEVSSLSIPSGTDKSFNFWVKPSDLTASRFLLDSGTGRLVLALRDINAVDTIAFYDGVWKETGVAAVAGVLQMVTFVFIGTTGKIYKDGIQIGSDTAYTQRAIGGTTQLGSNFLETNNAFKGALGSARVWSRALSALEIQQLYVNPNIGLWTPDYTRYYVPAAGGGADVRNHIIPAYYRAA